jgi:hypothetical protein
VPEALINELNVYVMVCPAAIGRYPVSESGLVDIKVGNAVISGKVLMLILLLGSEKAAPVAGGVVILLTAEGFM